MKGNEEYNLMDSITKKCPKCGLPAYEKRSGEEKTYVCFSCHWEGR